MLTARETYGRQSTVWDLMPILVKNRKRKSNVFQNQPFFFKAQKPKP